MRYIDIFKTPLSLYSCPTVLGSEVGRFLNITTVSVVPDPEINKLLTNVVSAAVVLMSLPTTKEPE